MHCFVAHGLRVLAEQSMTILSWNVFAKTRQEVFAESTFLASSFCCVVLRWPQDNTIRILILTDCGFDIADLSGGKWHGRKAISIAAFGGSEIVDASLLGRMFAILFAGSAPMPLGDLWMCARYGNDLLTILRNNNA